MFHSTQQLLHGDRLFQEGLGAELGGFHGGVDGAVSRHHDHGHRELTAGGPLLEQRDAVGVGHPDVEQHEVRTRLRALGAGLPRVLGQPDLITFIAQNLRQEFAYPDFIVDNQYLLHKFFPVHSCEKVTMTLVFSSH